MRVVVNVPVHKFDVADLLGLAKQRGLLRATPEATIKRLIMEYGMSLIDHMVDFVREKEEVTP